MQKDVASSSGVHTSVVGEASRSLSTETISGTTICLSELKDSIEGTKILAANRLSELQDAQQKNVMLFKQLQEHQVEMKDKKYVYSSHLYNLLDDQFLHWNFQVENYKELIDSLQADRSSIVRKEKELSTKAESWHAALNDSINSESIINELKLQLQNCIIRKNNMEIKMEEAVQESSGKDIEAEIHVMTSILSKELGMMEAQLEIWKETAYEAISLREKVQSLKVMLSEQIDEEKSLVDTCSQQDAKIKSLKALIEKMQKKKLESQMLLDMVGQQIHDNRDEMEIKESEQGAPSQAKHLPNALAEHALELRLKEANEAKAARQRSLSAAEAEIARLRAELDASDRDVLELKEAIQIKDNERDAYVSEIETMGKAYEDMRTQNQHLLQFVSQREDYNNKLVSEIVKIEQERNLLNSERHTLSEDFQQVHAALESLKLRTVSTDHQVKACILEEVKSAKEELNLAVNLQAAVWKLDDAEKEVKWLKSAVSSYENEYEQIQRKIDETRMELERERCERKKLDEELKEVNSEVAKMSLEAREATIQKLCDEIKDFKAKLLCGVCLTRPKEAVILKCGHLFCNPCLQSLLETWGCKCPDCGTEFETNDVRYAKMCDGGVKKRFSGKHYYRRKKRNQRK
ncbi:E3 ubiquitin-protein ligase BRE1-like 2 isoform X2 [Diospyros lotus]|nr:E3 ubiquitin-protein ligase BRE1-like 2 isoform X2 [Diospyros lotus]XP_052181273.1 E3 ubiquitin-protein ligase BRE1-like 2 isoform X2 [Diospyros lotus]XP_052181274.1 E3 ubiquitin-protein ligase BRE1-like 2 isoform X2 [Diospyros lotus]XP_052181275.1 E3 ubiquitin-protein ligase BRE1-like 2 isoform X2 [Diospyros lotus]XP_052181276.1 E3 ubiquitin-protein ligase BRE1-like 2 isoform X2 [Diospyros lotus]XP_052181277.1 E3 ubiquitin-protein ligase BRE1-like 2 isoform X2 [Diospyros lotus]